MVLFTLDRTDILRSKVVRPNWYPVLVTNFKSESSKTGVAGWVFDAVIEGGEYDGVPLRISFYENGKGFAVNFLKACGEEVEEKDGQQFDLSVMVGRRLEVAVTNEEYQGRPQNRVSDYRPSAR